MEAPLSSVAVSPDPQVMSAQAQPAAPQVNGSEGAGDAARSAAGQDVGAVCSGQGLFPGVERGPADNSSGGGGNGGGDVQGGTEALPQASTSTTRPLDGGSRENPEQGRFLMQGLEPRTETVDQVSASGGGSADQSARLPGEAALMPPGVESEHGFFETPRSRSTTSALRMDSARSIGQHGFPAWVSRLGEFFRAPQVTWIPSPLQSPPRPRSFFQSVSHEEQGRPPLPEHLPREAGASVGAMRPKGLITNPNNTTPSSSDLPTEAIQAEVQRQLSGLLDRLQYVEGENARLQEQLRQVQSQPHPPHLRSEPVREELPRVPDQTEQRGDPSRVHGASSDAWRDPLGALWDELAARRSPGVAPSIAEQEQLRVPATGQPAGVARAEGDATVAMLEALTKGMTQLQDMHAKSLQKGLEDDAPEAVKSSVAVLPLLPEPKGQSTGIVLQDWLAQITVAMQDLSTSSSTWWTKVMNLVQETYAKWLGCTPLERLQLQPGNSGTLAEGKWTRVNARACSMLLQSLGDTVRQDLIARRVVQNAVLILFRLHTTYQPGGASEKTLVLQSLQTPVACDTLEDTLSWLRSWPRWIQRCQDLNMLCPDGTVLAKALTSVTSKFISEGGDAQFRTQLLRSTLRIDGQPSLEDVRRYHQHLQAELESTLTSGTTTTTLAPKIKAMGAGQQQASSSGATGASVAAKAPCKYFFRSSGCRRGQKCPYGHDLSTLPKHEKARKCLSCGSEEHRQRECPTKQPRVSPKNGQALAQSSAPAAGPTMSTTSTTPRVQRLEPEGESSPAGATSTNVVTGEPVWTLESLLQAAVKVANAVPSTSGPSLNVLSIKQRCSMEEVESEGQAFALIDSGATHALRRARSEEEWQLADPVTVNLAGGQSILLRMNKAGTILVPTTASTDTTSSTPIVPLGALVGQLGYTMTWSKSKCKLEGKNGEVFSLRIREGCPEITERDALKLIARLEDDNLELLKSNVESTRQRVRAAAMALEKTWFDRLIAYVDGEITSEAWQAIETAPFFQDVPRPCLAGLVEAVPETNGWTVLRGLEHLNRRARKKLWVSNKWLVHLFSGERDKEELRHLEGHGYAVLELDISKGRTQDILRPSVWRVLEYAARKGKIAGIIGGPPQSSFMISRHIVGGPEPLRSNDFPYGNWPGQSDRDVYAVNRQTQLFARMIYLHALSTAGRLRLVRDPESFKEVAFLLENPRDPRGYLKFGDPLYPDVVSWWRTSMWSEYALEAGLHMYNFDMAALGKAFTRHTTIGTNLSLRHLDGLRMRYYSDGPIPTKAPACVWPPEFLEHLTIALRGWGVVPRMLRMSAEQWRDHVRRGHLPYRADCTVCVQAGGTGRRHARVEHPSAFVLSADLSGPVKIPGADPDARGAFPKGFKYIFVAKLRVPKTFVEDGRGTWIEYDEGDLAQEEYEDKDDGLSIEGKGSGDEVREVVGAVPDDEGDDPEPERGGKRDPDEDLDLAAPELVNLIFSAGLRDDKATTVLEAVQDVVLYCQSLNIPILRFHTDRGMEFQARATKQWLKGQGIRVTTSEAGVHQTNGAAESTVRWIKQRARALLLSAGLPQHLWPTAVTTAATMQRADVLGFEPMLAAPYGAKVMVRKRQLEGPKLDDLTPKWVQGVYVGRSESLSKGHLVYVTSDEGEKFIHTLHVRAGLRDPGPVEEGFHAEEPGPPERRVRGKSAASGDVVGVSKVTVFEDAELQRRAEAVLEDWSQEEAEDIVNQASKFLTSAENNYGMFRFGGKAGVTRATVERPWLARVLLKLLKDKAPDAEFASIFISVNNEKEVHIDRNNAMGTLNYILPLVMPRRGGEIWQELRNGDVVSGRILELQSQDGRVRYGCGYPLQEGQVFYLNPHRRHAVLPWRGERLVLVGYTPGVLQNLKRPDRELLWDLGFPMPLSEEEPKAEIYINMLAVNQVFANQVAIQDQKNEFRAVDKDIVIDKDLSGSNSVNHKLTMGQPSLSSIAGSAGVVSEEWPSCELCLLLREGTTDVAQIATEDQTNACILKAEVGFTDNVEVLLESLDGPLSIVHTVNPKEVAQYFERWIPSLGKEVQTLEHAVDRVSSEDPEVRDDVVSGRGQVLPMKIVFTVKPPDPPLEGEALKELYKRKSRIVICGNFAAHQPGEVYTNTAPAEIVRAAIALARCYDWDLGMIDVVAAFLQTPMKELEGAPLVYGVPPKLLIKAGFCKPGELWRLTHAVYGLQESPKLWGSYRDLRLAQIQLVYEGKRVTLKQGTVEPSWWSILQDGSLLIGIVVVYVDDLLICGRTSIIKELAKAIRAIWRTSDLQLISDGSVRFLGIEVSRCKQGFALSQRSYIEELVRVHNLPSVRKDIIPISKDLALFAVEEGEGDYTEAELRTAQQWAGELLWVSQRTRPDVAFTASLVGSLATRAPRRAAQIGEKALGFLQRTIDQCLVYDSDSSGLAAFSDASFAPEGGRSHTGWLVQLHGCIIAWRSGRQSTVTLSTAESELMALSEAVLALQSVDAMLQDVRICTKPHSLFSDSTSALAIANGSGSWRTRHLRIRSAWVSELITQQSIIVHQLQRGVSAG